MLLENSIKIQTSKKNPNSTKVLLIGQISFNYTWEVLVFQWGVPPPSSTQGQQFLLIHMWFSYKDRDNKYMHHKYSRRIHMSPINSIKLFILYLKVYMLIYMSYVIEMKISTINWCLSIYYIYIRTWILNINISDK